MRRAGITTVIIPKQNEKDLDDIPKEIRKDMKFVFAENVSDVFSAALGAKRPASDGKNGNGASESSERDISLKTGTAIRSSP